MKVILGVDDAKSSKELSRAVVKQFRAEATEVTVLHVLQPVGPAPPQMDPGYAPELEGQREHAHRLVEHTAKELRAAGFKVSTQVKIGDIREVLIDTASDWQADLIVVGSHGKRGLQRFLLGGVAEFVARHAGCSVQIVRLREKRSADAER
ncbi:MAG: universal stress protein [Acidobacteriota bacterium]